MAADGSTTTHAPRATPPGATPRPARIELRALLLLAGPIAASQIGQQLIGVVDTAVVGRLGTVAIGAVGLGNALFSAIAVIGVGIMLGLDPLIAQAVGASELTRARRVLWQGVWLSLLITIPLTVTALVVALVLPHVGIGPTTVRQTTAYLVARLAGLWPVLLTVGLRCYLQARGITRPLVLSVVAANVLNLGASWALVFGDAGLSSFGLPHLGIPALGVIGAGWASTGSSVLVTLVLVGSIPRPHAGEGERASRRLDRALLGRAARLGAPVGLQLLAEVGVFALVTVIAGHLGARALAAHQVALTLASFTFQVPFAVGAATSVRVGQAIGREDAPGTRLAGLVGLTAGGSFMLLTAAAFLLVPGPLARLLTDQRDVIAAAVPLLGVAAAFQLADGLQAVGGGALRGAGDTRAAMFANLVGHYAVGLPLGAALCFGLGWGVAGLWWGLSAGLVAVAVLLTARFLWISRRAVARA